MFGLRVPSAPEPSQSALVLRPPPRPERRSGAGPTRAGAGGPRMKFLPAQFAYLMQNRQNRRNLRGCCAASCSFCW